MPHHPDIEARLLAERQRMEAARRPKRAKTPVTAQEKKPPKRKKNRRQRRHIQRGPRRPTRELANAKSIPYNEYLKTDWWRNLRAYTLFQARYACSRCGKRGELQVHHKTYARLGRERDEDLEVLCVSCHQGKHEHDIAANSHLEAIAPNREETVKLLAMLPD